MHDDTYWHSACHVWALGSMNGLTFLLENL
jgi:hypothetical protein